jgi:hypothetical protein
VSTIAPGAPQDDPSSREGWISQLLGALTRAWFEQSWAPWLRIIVTVVIAGALWLAFLIVTRSPGSA